MRMGRRMPASSRARMLLMSRRTRIPRSRTMLPRSTGEPIPRSDRSRRRVRTWRVTRPMR